jgi:hypothetical protein
MGAAKKKWTETVDKVIGGVQRTKRGHLYTMRLSEKEVANLNTVASYLGMPGAVAIRFLVKRAAEAISRGETVGQL